MAQMSSPRGSRYRCPTSSMRRFHRQPSIRSATSPSFTDRMGSPDVRSDAVLYSESGYLLPYSANSRSPVSGGSYNTLADANLSHSTEALTSYLNGTTLRTSERAS